MRASTLEKSVNESQTAEITIEGDDGWVETHVGFVNKSDDDIPGI